MALHASIVDHCLFYPPLIGYNFMPWFSFDLPMSGFWFMSPTSLGNCILLSESLIKEDRRRLFCSQGTVIEKSGLHFR